jgi:hypothetical protein
MIHIEDHYATLLETLAEHSDNSSQVRAAADEAIQAFPRSARLWLWRGRLLTFSLVNGEPVHAEVRRSFEQAVELDPELAEAWEELADFHDGIRDDPEAALRCWQRAEEVRERVWGTAVGVRR